MSIEIPTKYIRTLYEYNGADFPVQNLEVYRYFIERNILGIQRKNTSLYKLYADGLNKGNHPNGIEDIPGIFKRLFYIEKLFKDIKKDGIQEPLDIFIGEHGEYVIFEGHHRFAIASILGLKTVPVRIIRVADAWTKMKDDMQKEYNGKFLYSPIDHPDFATWGILRNSDRFNAIINRMSVLYGSAEGKFARKRILDIGSHMGYFSMSLTRMGAEVIGIEGNPNYIKVAYVLSHFNRLPITFIQQDAWEYLLNDSDRYDYILCLSFLHHYPAEKARSLISMISKHTNTVYADIGEEKQMKNEDLIKMFLEVGFNNYPILEGDDGRMLYEFRKS